jgi:anti-anti-sigma factor
MIGATMRATGPTSFHAQVTPSGEIVLRGELDLHTVKDLQQLVDDLSSPGKTLVLDMSQLSFMDTAGIHLLLNVRTSTGGPVVVRNPSPAARRVLELCDGRPGSEAWVVEQN